MPEEATALPEGEDTSGESDESIMAPGGTYLNRSEESITAPGEVPLDGSQTSPSRLPGEDTYRSDESISTSGEDRYIQVRRVHYEYVSRGGHLQVRGVHYGSRRPVTSLTEYL